MFKFLVLAALLALAVAHPTKKETSSAKVSEWRKDKIVEHEEPIAIKIEVPVKKEYHHHEEKHEESKQETHHNEPATSSQWRHEHVKSEGKSVVYEHKHEEPKHEIHHHEPASSSQWRHENVKSEGKSVVFEHKHY